MIRKPKWRLLVEHGDEYALVIDQEHLDLLKIQPDIPLDVSVVDGALYIRPLDQSARARMIDESLKRINEQYGNMMRDLAKGPE